MADEATIEERLTWGFLAFGAGLTVHQADPERLPKAVSVCGKVLQAVAPPDWRTRTADWDYQPCRRGCWDQPKLFREGVTP